MKAISAELRCMCEWLAHVAKLPGIDSGVQPAAEPLDVLRFRQLIEENQLVPLWISSGGMPDLKSPIRWPAPPLEWRQAYYQSGRQAALRLTVLRQVGRVLHGGPAAVVLKGMALTPALYPEAAARPMRDIDLLFASAADKENARDRLVAAGFSMGRAEFIHHHLPAVFDPAGRVSIELHDNLLTPPLPPDCMAAIWRDRQSNPDLPELSTLNPVAGWFHHALHAVSDPVDSPLIRDLFEVAWMASRLTASEREAVLELASLSGRQEAILRSGNLAADLFGGPRWGDFPAGPIESGCRKRLEWTRPTTLGQRFVQHAGRERFNYLCAAPDQTNPFPWLIRVAQGILRRLFQGVWSRFRLWPIRYQRPPYSYVMIDGNALIRNADTRDVHMLNELAAAIWNAAAEPMTLSELARMEGKSESASERRHAVRRLIQSGLLVAVPFRMSRKRERAS